MSKCHNIFLIFFSQKNGANHVFLQLNTKKHKDMKKRIAAIFTIATLVICATGCKDKAKEADTKAAETAATTEGFGRKIY